MEVFDIRLTDDFDLLFADGDLSVAESTQQHQRLLLLSSKGDFKQSPEATVGLSAYIERTNPGELVREVRTLFARDGMRVERIKIDTENLEIDACYEN